MIARELLDALSQIALQCGDLNWPIRFYEPNPVGQGRIFTGVSWSAEGGQLEIVLKQKNTSLADCLHSMSEEGPNT